MVEVFNDRAINLLHYLFDDVKQSDLEDHAIYFLVIPIVGRRQPWSELFARFFTVFVISMIVGWVSCDDGSQISTYHRSNDGVMPKFCFCLD